MLLILLGFIACPRRDSNRSERPPNRTERREKPSLPDLEQPRERKPNTNPLPKGSVRMEKYSGVWEIPVYINDVKMNFIFDTGAGLISISLTELEFLAKQGAVTQDDVLRVQNFIDANGDISEGLVINLKTVRIANRTLYDVEASVVNNDIAPLLLGQSALARFGKFTVDYDEQIISFN